MKHLKGLDTLRAIASLIVVWSHIELLKPVFGISESSLPWYPNAHFSVTLFFALSGFLITYLLIKEYDKSGTISFKKFYIRRILRIWPLYYLIIFLSYFLISKEVTVKTIAFCIAVFPNIPPALKQSWTGSPHIWSIGVEEQFYMFWPLFIYLIPKKKFVKSIIVFILLFIALPHVLNYVNLQTIKNANYYSFVQKFFSNTRFDNMAIGGVFGFLYAKGRSWLSIFYERKILAIFYIVFPFIVWFCNIKFGVLTDAIYSLFFTFLILVAVSNPFYNIDSQMSRFLGRISYGIYMYHWIVIVLIFRLLKTFEITASNLIVYPVVFGVTILISWISFEKFEGYFLTLKRKFEVK